MIRRLAVLALLTAAGCAHQATDQAPTAAAKLLALQSFELRGRIGVRSGADGFNGSVRWAQDGSNLNLLIYGPLGVGRTQLLGTEAGVELIDAKGVRVFYADPEQAFYDNFGWSLPVTALRYWVLGLPQPGSVLTEPQYGGDTAQRRLSQWRQNGWVVQVTEYADYDNWVLPRKLTLSSGVTTIKLVANNWQIPVNSH